MTHRWRIVEQPSAEPSTGPPQPCKLLGFRWDPTRVRGQVAGYLVKVAPSGRTLSVTRNEMDPPKRPRSTP
jgi:hypothetical protein